MSSKIDGCCCPPKGYSGIWAGAMCPVHQGLRRLAAPVVERQPVSIPRISGMGRDADHQKALVLYLGDVPTDDDIRAIQEALRAPPELAELRAVTLPSTQDDGAEGRGYNKALRDCAAALEAAGVPFTNDPRTTK